MNKPKKRATANGIPDAPFKASSGSVRLLVWFGSTRLRFSVWLEKTIR